LTEKSFKFEFSADKGRLEKVFGSIFAATQFSNKEPIVVIDDGILEGFDLSVKALVPYVRCNQTFFTGDVLGNGYFCLTKAFLEKFSKGFSSGTVTVTGNATITKDAGRGVVTSGEISVVGENTEYTEPISLPEFPEAVQTSGSQLDYWPKFGAKIERDDEFIVVNLKLAMDISGVMSIQDIAAMPPSKQMTMAFGPEVVVASIKDAGRYSRELPIEYKIAPEADLNFLANNKYFERAIKYMEGKVLVSVYGVAGAEESIIVFSQKTEDLEYIFFVSGKN
jgi:hypothetical protein